MPQRRSPGPAPTPHLRRLARALSDLEATVRLCSSARPRASSSEDRVRLIVPFEPDSNLICLAVNRNGNRSLGRMNRFARRAFRRMRVDAARPVQFARFIGSYTSLRREGGADGQCGRILRDLGIDPKTFVAVPVRPGEEADHIFILRHTLMNPFLIGWARRAQLHRHVLGLPGRSDRRRAAGLTPGWPARGPLARRPAPALAHCGDAFSLGKRGDAWPRPGKPGARTRGRAALPARLAPAVHGSLPIPDLSCRTRHCSLAIAIYAPYLALST